MHGIRLAHQFLSEGRLPKIDLMTNDSERTEQLTETAAENSADDININEKAAKQGAPIDASLGGLRVTATVSEAAASTTSIEGLPSSGMFNPLRILKSAMSPKTALWFTRCRRRTSQIHAGAAKIGS